MFDHKSFISDMLAFTSSDEDPDVIIQKFVQFMCETFESDRAYIFENNENGGIDNTYEFCRPGVIPQKDNLQNVPYEMLASTWYAEYKKKNNILIYDLEEYRTESEWVYSVLKPQGINTLVSGPLIINGECIGMYGVDNPPEDVMNEVSDMITTMEIFITMLIRMRNYSRMVEEYAGIDSVEGLSDKRASILNNVLLNAFNSASDYVYIYVRDMKTGLTRWSKSLVDYFGMPDEFMFDAAQAWIEHVHPDDREMYCNDLDAVFNGETDKHNCQYRAKNIYGEYVWVECKGSMITRKSGERVFAGMMTRLDNQNIYDSLTGLKTKTQFYNYNFLGEQGTVVLLGVDHFKHTIATYGYNVGDYILVHIGKVLSEIVGSTDRVFRFSGDEFMIILPYGTEYDVQCLFEEIKKKLGTITLENGVPIRITLSGAAIEYDKTGVVTDTIVNQLETTLLFVKGDNRGEISFYTGEMQEKEKRASFLKKELTASIENNFVGFELFYQPWMDEKGERIVGCEALLRWKGETIKDSFPGEFIPVLEESGEIIEVGRFVMREAMRQQKEWEDKYGKFIVSFNVSYSQFLQTGYVEEIEQTVKELGINPNNIYIELTESCDVQSPDILAEVFEKLRILGFKIALDDFGTGYSSMEMLKKLPCDGIKIEHSFVRELSDQGHDMDFAIIRAILSLCKEIGQNVVIEGVENEAVAEIIKGMNAGYLQGYYYSRPVCKADFEKLIAEINLS